MDQGTTVRVRTLVVAIGIALAVGVVIGVMASVELEDRDLGPRTSPPSGFVGPARIENGVPVGYARTEDGAVAAATNFNLIAANDRLTDVGRLLQAMDRIAAPTWRTEAVAQARSGHEYVLETYGRDADISSSVLAYDVQKYTRSRVAIDLWTVTVLSGSKRPRTEEVWGVVTVDLTWIEGDWRVASTESTPGPAPTDVPSEPSNLPLANVMENFQEYTYGPRP